DPGDTAPDVAVADKAGGADRALPAAGLGKEWVSECLARCECGKPGVRVAGVPPQGNPGKSPVDLVRTSSRATADRPQRNIVGRVRWRIGSELPGGQPGVGAVDVPGLQACWHGFFLQAAGRPQARTSIPSRAS